MYAWKYRASNTRAIYDPNWTHSTLLEFVVWGISGIIITILAVITWVSTHRLDPYRPLDVATKSLTIQVIALDWKWLFIYPEQNIATVNYVKFPVNVPVNFKITADAPMNSFWIPQLGGQIYAMTGMQTQLHLMANEMGDYNGLSASFSGPGFSGMHFIANVSSKEDFDQWVDKIQQSGSVLNSAKYAEIAMPSENNPVAYYSPVRLNLFNSVIFKFMMPGQNLAAGF
jgi:cytochrome o ubiquinol oxidase subunit II